VSSELINPGQTWQRRSGGGAVKVTLVDEQFIAFTAKGSDVDYLPRSRFLALYRQEGQR
jgi:hypothetical protein